ncbi:proclotting enzyme-like [Tropilaelaps mercedesae]|uniref:Proclotting enzyme-like n=1 Tax=Tropilaelaps mercedesae TaxID=418985 RepID=A0A1V9X9B2_9ACAR|nr:proclotting enzyme-like [Tropilaelaps mercedesae]
MLAILLATATPTTMLGQAAIMPQTVEYRRSQPQIITLSNGNVLIIERQRREAPDLTARPETADSNTNVAGLRQRNVERPIVKKTRFYPSVVGGHDAEPIYPWMVPIVAKGIEDRYLIWCGSSLLTDRHLLTAAHCFDIRQDPETFSALIRANNLSQPESVVDLAKITMHPAYQPGKFYNDVAIVTLAKPVPNPKPVCLPIEDPIGVDDAAASVELLGYGSLAFAERASETLQVASLEVFDNAECRANYTSKQDTALSQGIIRTHLCAGVRDGSKDACQNDSGGPLVSDGALGYRVLVGVVAFGYQCAREGYPGVYSRVKEFLPWILPTIRRG